MPSFTTLLIFMVSLTIDICAPITIKFDIFGSKSSLCSSQPRYRSKQADWMSCFGVRDKFCFKSFNRKPDYLILTRVLRNILSIGRQGFDSSLLKPLKPEPWLKEGRGSRWPFTAAVSSSPLEPRQVRFKLKSLVRYL